MNIPENWRIREIEREVGDGSGVIIISQGGGGSTFSVDLFPQLLNHDYGNVNMGFPDTLEEAIALADEYIADLPREHPAACGPVNIDADGRPVEAP